MKDLDGGVEVYSISAISECVRQGERLSLSSTMCPAEADGAAWPCDGTALTF